MKLSISNALIFLSTLITILSYFNNDLLSFWLNHFFLESGNYKVVILQFILYSFLHWWIFHLLFNSLFLYIFWNQVEYIIWKRYYLIFFIFITIFNWISLIFLTKIWTNTIWISWFGLAILSFLTIYLYEKKDAEYKWWITWIVLNILVWFSAKISLIWHLFWAIWWGIFYFIYKFLKSKSHL